MIAPGTIEDAAIAIRDNSQVVIQGNATKSTLTSNRTLLKTSALNRLIEHNAGDFTAVLEAGVRLADAQRVFAQHGQMLAIDPPHQDATIGGIMAANDSGPLRHRYGSMRDLVIGVTVVLSDGTIAKSGGQVIKNVAGYDLAKLFTGSQGTLGLVARVAVRLHPRPRQWATVVADASDTDALCQTAAALARLPLEADCLDLRWHNGAGQLLIRFSGAVAQQRAEAVRRRIALDTQVVTEDEPIWQQQRALQEGRTKIAGLATDLPGLMALVKQAGGAMVARAALGLAWVAGVTVEPTAIESGVQALMRRVKERFDPTATFPTLAGQAGEDPALSSPGYAKTAEQQT